MQTNRDPAGSPVAPPPDGAAVPGTTPSTARSLARHPSEDRACGASSNARLHGQPVTRCGPGWAQVQERAHRTFRLCRFRSYVQGIRTPHGRSCCRTRQSQSSILRRCLRPGRHGSSKNPGFRRGTHMSGWSLWARTVGPAVNGNAQRFPRSSTRPRLSETGEHILGHKVVARYTISGKLSNPGGSMTPSSQDGAKPVAWEGVRSNLCAPRELP